MSNDTSQEMDRQDVAERAPQVKICGLTQVEEAVLCVEAGAHAIGCVFYPASPRFVTDEQAYSITKSLPEWVCTVGVFVNQSFMEIMSKVEVCGLKAVQLHGKESAQLVEKLRLEPVQVIKALFANAAPSFETASSYSAHAYLVECAGGKLPGGNALAWDWEAAAELSERHPLVLAGGLDPQNVSHAIHASCPDAVDVSSGVELEPGRKDLRKVRLFVKNVLQSHCRRTPRRIFI